MKSDRHGRPHKRSAVSVDKASWSDALNESSATVKAIAESAKGFGSSMLDAAARRKDPRVKHLKKIRRARRRSIRFGAASTTTAVGTAGMAVLSAPEWAMLVGGGGTALLAVPAAFALTRLRRLRSQPVPVGAPTRRVLPPRHSAAHEPMLRLAGAEQSLYELLGILARSEAIGTEDVEDMISVASDAAQGLGGVATDILALERAGASSAVTKEHVTAGIDSAARDLVTGVDQYEDLVAAAARMTRPVSSASGSALENQRRELLSATDRLQGWADALEEIAEIRSRHR